MTAITSVKVGTRQLRLSNLDKVLYPTTAFTKGDLIAYYVRLAPVLVPHLKGRPITLKRYPNGVEEKFFYEKRCPAHKPDWVRTATLASGREGQLSYCVIDSAATLAWVANLASIELHALLARGRSPNRPLGIVFDLDPGPPAGILECIPIAFRLKEMLADLGFQSFVKMSGGKGMHVWTPLNTAATFKRTKSLAQTVASMLEADDPRHITSNMSRSRREGKIFIDWSQNDDRKTTAVVYSLRAREHPTVSAPVTWDELREAERSRSPSRLIFTANDMDQRLEKVGDLFAPALTLKQKLPPTPEEVGRAIKAIR